MYEILILIGVVFGILQVILFFKVWKMTDDINELKQLYKTVNADKLNIKSISFNEPKESIKQEINPLHIDAIVLRVSDNKRMTIRDITSDGKYSCYSGIKKQGEYTANEITPLPLNNTFSIGDLVVLKESGKQMRIKEITSDGKFACYTNNGQFHEGDFNEEEIRLF